MARALTSPKSQGRSRSQGQREADGQLQAVEGESRRFKLSFSSEAPYRRWFGNEILDHGDGAVDMSRLHEMGVVLFNHNRNAVIGKVTSAWIEGGRGQAEIEFDTDEQSETIRQKVESGTLRGVSVGYSVADWEDVAEGRTSADKRFAGPCCIARHWTPNEISIVSVPADASVGVGRELEEEPPQDVQREEAPDLSYIETLKRQLIFNQNLMEV